MNKPLVTVITPVYNCAEFIGETVKSVVTQDYKRIRYYIIDDGSTDKTKDILQGYETESLNRLGVIASNLPNIAGVKKVNGEYDVSALMRMGISAVFLGVGYAMMANPHIYSSDKNYGEQETVNDGLAMVTGKYFMIVNADDPLLPGAVSKLVAFMEANPDVLCGYPDYNVIGEDSKVRCHVTSREYDFRWMVRHHTWLPSVGSIFRSEVIKRVGYRDTSFRWLGDADYWLRVGIVGRMAHIPQTLACWRKRDGQASSNKSQLRAKEHIRVMQKFYSTPKLPGSLLRVKSEAVCWSYLVAAAVTSSKLEVLQYAVKAVWHYPQLLVDIKFWDLFLKRAYFILRR